MKLSFKVLMSVAMSFGFIAGLLFLGEALAQEQPMAATDAQVDSDTFRKELTQLRSEKESSLKMIEQMRQEREQFVKEIRRVENLNAKYTQQIDALREQMASQQQALEDRMMKMESDVKENAYLDSKGKEKKVEPLAAAPTIHPVEVEKQAKEVFLKGGDLDPEDQKFKEELARAHYNMGNVYFERGEYRRAVVEYYQAVDLMPYDQDAHYNLAFVSGEFLGDQETALKHYQWYLYLNPNAKDKKLVEEKIVAAKISIRSRLDSKVEATELNGHMNVAR